MKSASAQQSASELNEAFLKSAAKGDLKAMRKWVADGMPVIWPGAGQTTALICAAENGHADAVKLLIASGAELNAAATGHWTAIALAASRGHEAVVEALLDAGANPNVETKLGDTPLSLATKNGKKSVARMLELRGARLATSKPLDDLSYQCANEYQRSVANSALFGPKPTRKAREVAAKKSAKLFKEVERMVASGAPGGDYALWQAAGLGHVNLVKLLLRAKAHPNCAPHGSSALSKACEHGQLETARLLLDAGASINYGGKGTAPILEAAKKGHMKIVAELCQRGADVNARQRLGPTPLLLATTAGNLEMMRILLDAKADVNQAGTVEVGPRPKPTVGIDRIEGSKISMRTTHYPDAPEALDVSPLIVATRRNHVDAVKLLVEQGAELEATDKEGLTALAWARKLGLKAIQELLTKGGADDSIDDDGSVDNALIKAAGGGGLNRVKELLAQGANASAHVDSVEERKTALTEAAKVGHADIVSVLLKAGAEVDKTVGERLGTLNQTALMLAAECGHANVVEILLKAGADINAVDALVFGGGGNTPLHYAAIGGNENVIRLLLNAGAKRSAQNKNRQTPIQLAASNGHRGAIDLLLASGSRVVSRKGKVASPLYDVVFSGNVSAVKRLLKANPQAHGQDINFASSVCFAANLDILIALVNSGMPIDGLDDDGETPLMQAVRAGRSQVVRFLLSRGADPTSVSRSGESALKIAHAFGHKNLVRFLSAIKKPASK